MKCVIAGAGPAGVLLALRLARDGWTVTLIEPHGDPRSPHGAADPHRAYEIILADRGVQPLYQAGVNAAEALRVYTGSVIHAGPGRVLARSVKDNHFPASFWTRTEISAALLDTCDLIGMRPPGRVEVLWGHQVEDINLQERSLTVRVAQVFYDDLFGDNHHPDEPPPPHDPVGPPGKKQVSPPKKKPSRKELKERPTVGQTRILTYDLLVGADGARSTVRMCLAARLPGFSCRTTPNVMGYCVALLPPAPTCFKLAPWAHGVGLHGKTHFIAGKQPTSRIPLGNSSMKNRTATSSPSPRLSPLPGPFSLLLVDAPPGSTARADGMAGAGRKQHLHSTSIPCPTRAVVIGPLESLRAVCGSVGRAEAFLIEQFPQLLSDEALSILADAMGVGSSAACHGGWAVRCSSLVGPRVALIGDAAHGMYPSLGLGCNTALQGASVLADLLHEAVGTMKKDDGKVKQHEGKRHPGEMEEVEESLGAALMRYNEVWNPQATAAVDMSADFYRRQGWFVRASIILQMAHRCLPWFFPKHATTRLRTLENLVNLKQGWDSMYYDSWVALVVLLLLMGVVGAGAVRVTRPWVEPYARWAWAQYHTR